MKLRTKTLLVTSLLLSLAATTCVAAVAPTGFTTMGGMLFLVGLAIVLFLQTTPVLFLVTGLAEGILDVLLRRPTTK